jgi:hypothetical protein
MSIDKEEIKPERRRIMNKQFKTVKNVFLAVGALVATAQAGVPLNGLQGDGGIAFNPLAYLAGNYDDKAGGGLGEYVSKPQVGAWYVNLENGDINWYAASAAFSVAKRVEFSYGYGFIDAKNVDDSIDTQNIGAKVKVLDENAFDTVWVPAVAVGSIWKYTDSDVTKALGLDDQGADFYIVATKLITQTPLPVLLSAGVLESDEVVNGVLGHGDYGTVGFGNIDILPAKNIAVGVEYKQGVDAGNSDTVGSIQNADYWDGHVAWFATDKLTLVGAYADTGDADNGFDHLGVGRGFVLSAQYAF